MTAPSGVQSPFRDFIFSGIDEFKAYGIKKREEAPSSPPPPNNQELERPTVVFHAAFELKHYGVGGVGSVVSSLTEAEHAYKQPSTDKKTIDCRLVTPFYSFLEKNQTHREFVGTIPHFFNGVIYYDSVYKEKDPSGLKQYLIKPDQRLNGLFDVDQPKNLYSYSSKETNFEKKVLYFGGAVASLAAHYKGKKTLKKVDVLQCQSYALSISTTLIKELYSKKLADLGLPCPKISTILHCLNHDQGCINGTLFTKATGLIRSNKYINLTHELLQSVDLAITISYQMRKLAQKADTSFGLHTYMKKLEDEGKLTTIIHGISTSNFNPKDIKKFGLLAQKEDELISDWKMRVKEHLVKLGVIKDATKPLFAYVGRYSQEKGVDQLPHAKEAILKEGGSFVIMGRLNGDKMIENLIFKLKSESKTQKDFHVITDETEQSKIGHFIRAAADFMIVPSYFEACGLVPYESYCFGAQVITSWNQGLKDVVTCYNNSPDGATKGTGYTYFSPSEIKVQLPRIFQNTFIAKIINWIATKIFYWFHQGTNIKQCCRNVLTKWKALTKAEKEAIQKRIIALTPSLDWNSDNKIGAYNRAYFKLRTNKSMIEKVQK